MFSFGSIDCTHRIMTEFEKDIKVMEKVMLRADFSTQFCMVCRRNVAHVAPLIDLD